MSNIFEGLKVIDCGSFIAAPAAATLLADFGADVIKIEPPGAGDAFRQVPKLPGMPQSQHPYGWLLDNRNKRGLALDLVKSEGQAALYRLIADADVFITNYPLAVRKKLGIDHTRLAALNERLIYASFTGYGESGAEASKPGFDVTAYWAHSQVWATTRLGFRCSRRSPWRSTNASAPAAAPWSARRCWPTASGRTASWRRPRCAVRLLLRGRRARRASMHSAVTTTAVTGAGCYSRS